MKNTLFLFIAGAALSLSSCKKEDYLCHCDGGSIGNGSTMVVDGNSKKQADKNCTDLNNPAGSVDGFYDCKLQ